MIIDDIRTATRPIHEELDNWLMPQVQQVDTPEKYAALLKAFYTYFNPVMKKIGDHIDLTALPDYAERRKPALILEDLESIGQPFDDILPQTDLPVVLNSAQAFGALYVLEGSTLGGVYLAKALAQNLDIKDHAGLFFFYGYGKESKEKWTRFIDYLNAFGEKEENKEEIVKAANDTFVLFKKHLEERIK
jgi:heme oxygenase (biliverdin-IX-beta and delta-forming)